MYYLQDILCLKSLRKILLPKNSKKESQGAIQIVGAHKEAHRLKIETASKRFFCSLKYQLFYLNLRIFAKTYFDEKRINTRVIL